MFDWITVKSPTVQLADANSPTVQLADANSPTVQLADANSPTPTRRRIKSSRNVGELVFNPVQLIRS